MSLLQNQNAIRIIRETSNSKKAELKQSISKKMSKYSRDYLRKFMSSTQCFREFSLEELEDTNKISNHIRNLKSQDDRVAFIDYIAQTREDRKEQIELNKIRKEAIQNCLEGLAELGTQDRVTSPRSRNDNPQKLQNKKISEPPPSSNQTKSDQLKNKSQPLFSKSYQIAVNYPKVENYAGKAVKEVQEKTGVTEPEIPQLAQTTSLPVEVTPSKPKNLPPSEIAYLMSKGDKVDDILESSPAKQVYLKVLTSTRAGKPIPSSSERPPSRKATITIFPSAQKAPDKQLKGVMSSEDLNELVKSPRTSKLTKQWTMDAIGSRDWNPILHAQEAADPQSANRAVPVPTSSSGPIPDERPSFSSKVAFQ